MIATAVQRRAWFHRLIRSARVDLAIARSYREAGFDTLAHSYLQLAAAHRRTAHGFLKGATQ